DDRLVRAPFPGVVGLRLVSPGALVRPGDEIATLDDVSSVKLDFSVPETLLSNLSQGIAVRAVSEAFPDEAFEGVVEFIDSRVDPVTRSIVVRSVLQNEDGKLRPGMLMTVRLIKDAREAPAAPELAVVAQGEDMFVFVLREASAAGEAADGPPQVEMRRVELGQRRAGFIEVVSGLAEGERIVVEGVHRLRDGQAVRFAGGRNEGEDGPLTGGGPS
ncbi:MAG: efflux RND transporter periplasmic adaptor subunit, partial [Pseudomonadota bacterium]